MMLDEMAKYIAANSTAGVVNTSIFKGHLPSTPDTAIVLFEDAGSGQQSVLGALSAPAWENPHLQIICRSTDYRVARRRSETIYRLLDGVVGVRMYPNSTATDTGALYLRVEPLQVPFGLGEDDNGRSLVSCNYRVMKGLST